MRFHIGTFFSTRDLPAGRVAIRDWAQAAEAIGFNFVEVSDHVPEAARAALPDYQGPYDVIRKLLLMPWLVIFMSFLLTACSSMQYTANRVDDAGDVQVLYDYPKGEYKNLGVIDFTFYQPGFRGPTVSDVLPKLKAKVREAGGTALIIRNQRNDVYNSRQITISAEVLDVRATSLTNASPGRPAGQPERPGVQLDVPVAPLKASVAESPVLERRVALIIGNSAYKDAPLKNPVNDARDMVIKLEQLGFQATDMVYRENLTVREIGATLREFRSKLLPGSIALMFYAGHGVQVKGENYLPAVDGSIQGEEDVEQQSLRLGIIMRMLDESKTRMNLVFLDACRNNPFVRGFRSAARGLAREAAPSGTLISYATRPGEVAIDGAGRNGLYTWHLLTNMDSPGVPVEEVLKRVVRGVKKDSQGAQEPWWEGSIDGDFYFKGQNRR